MTLFLAYNLATTILFCFSKSQAHWEWYNMGYHVFVWWFEDVARKSVQRSNQQYLD